MTYNYAGIVYDSLVDGEGIGATVFTQGCSHHCPGCHNPETWNKDGGKPFTAEILEELMAYFEDGNGDHLTMSGGDPLDNIELTEYIVCEFKKRFPDKKVWLYTGYTYEQIIEDEKCKTIIENTDYLVDGLFVLSLKTLNKPFCGSSNQRIIDIKNTLKEGEIVLWKEGN